MANFRNKRSDRRNVNKNKKHAAPSVSDTVSGVFSDRGSNQLRGVGTSDLQLPKANINELRKHIFSIDGEYLYQCIHDIEVSFLGELDRDNTTELRMAELALRKTFLSEIICQTLSKHENNVGAVFAFTQHVNLLILKIAREKNELAVHSDIEYNKELFSIIILSAADIIINGIDPLDDQFEKKLENEMEKQAFLNSNQRPWMASARGCIFFNELAKEEYKNVLSNYKKEFRWPSDAKFDSFKQLFAKLTNFKMEEYNYAASYMQSILLQAIKSTDKTFFSRMVTSNYLLGKDTKIKAALDHFLVHFEPADPSAHSIDEGDRGYLYDFLELRKHPICCYKGKYYLSSGLFLSKCFWDGPYYILIEELSKIGDDGSKQLLSSHLGHLFEYYCFQLGKWGFKKHFSEIAVVNRKASKKDSTLGDGVIELDENWIVPVEMRGSRFSSEVFSGESSFEETHFFKIQIYAKSKQLSERVLDYIAMKPNFQKSKLKITPVILMERSLPAYKKGKWPEFWSEMEELRKKDSNKASEFVWDSYPEQVGRPIFMGVDAWERLTVFAKKKGDLKQFFARIARPNDYVSGSEIAFQFQKITNRNQEYSVNTVIKSYYECVLQEMLTFTGNVFIIPATVSTEDEDYWTKVFNTNFKK